MSQLKYCPHCQPLKVTSHSLEYIEYFLYRLILPILRPGVIFYNLLDQLPYWLNLKIYFLHLGRCFGLVNFVANPPRNIFYNRTLIFWDEAKKKNLEIYAIYFLRKPTELFYVKAPPRKFIFTTIPLANYDEKIDEKIIVKKRLQKAGLPVPLGKEFTFFSTGFKFGQSLGYPLVVKPARASLSRHATYPIYNKEELREAIKIALKCQSAYIVEKFLRGALFRMTVVDRRHVFACQRRPPLVVGDGGHSIRELIKIKNSDPRRGPWSKKNTTLHEIVVNDEMLNYLKERNLTLNDIPPRGETIYLGSKSVLGLGGDVVELTESVLEINKELFRRAARCFLARIISFDFICLDLTRPWPEQECGIIEANSLPFLDMHQYPSEGVSQPIAKIIWQRVLSS